MTTAQPMATAQPMGPAKPQTLVQQVVAFLGRPVFFLSDLLRGNLSWFEQLYAFVFGAVFGISSAVLMSSATLHTLLTACLVAAFGMLLGSSVQAAVGVVVDAVARIFHWDTKSREWTKTRATLIVLILVLPLALLLLALAEKLPSEETVLQAKERLEKLNSSDASTEEKAVDAFELARDRFTVWFGNVSIPVYELLEEVRKEFDKFGGPDGLVSGLVRSITDYLRTNIVGEENYAWFEDQVRSMLLYLNEILQSLMPRLDPTEPTKAGLNTGDRTSQSTENPEGSEIPWGEKLWKQFKETLAWVKEKGKEMGKPSSFKPPPHVVKMGPPPQYDFKGPTLGTKIFHKGLNQTILSTVLNQGDFAQNTTRNVTEGR